MSNTSVDLSSICFKNVNGKTIPHQDFLFKLIIIGDSGVGKTCLLARIMDKDFQLEH